jgi:hypothetical protein
MMSQGKDMQAIGEKNTKEGTDHSGMMMGSDGAMMKM